MYATRSLETTPAPTRRSAAPDERVLVRWAVHAGESDAQLLRRHGKAALCQERLRRLLDEAAAQGAAPTDDDLAAALGVSRRTILRDIAQLPQRRTPCHTPPQAVARQFVTIVPAPR